MLDLLEADDLFLAEDFDRVEAEIVLGLHCRLIRYAVYTLLERT